MRKSLLILFALLFAVPFFANAQNTCASILKNRVPEAPYRYNNVSKSAFCQTGKKYEFILPMTKGLEYRIYFLASSVFNNDIDVEFIDMNTGQTKLKRPGKILNGTPTKFQTAFQPFSDERTGKMINPYFEFIPESTTSLKIILTINNPRETTLNDEGVFQYVTPDPNEIVEAKKGCVTVFVVDKVTEEEGM